MNIEIIPAIDILGGKCVRLVQGDYEQQTIYNENPLDVACGFAAKGVKRLHLVDLDGARSKHVVNIDVVKDIAENTDLTIDFGGGIKTDEDIKQVFDAGAQMVTIGSVAVTNPTLFCKWLDEYGSERIILGADVKNGRISINGWKEEGNDELIPFLKRYVGYGVSNILCTDISKDGMMTGPALDIYKEIQAECPTLNIIASGGVGSMSDIEALDNIAIRQVVVGKAIYEGRVKLC